MRGYSDGLIVVPCERSVQTFSVTQRVHDKGPDAVGIIGRDDEYVTEYLPPVIRITPVFAFCALVLAGCGGSGAGSAPSTPIAEVATGLNLQVASSDLAVGRNRFTFGIIDGNHPVDVPKVSLEFFTVKGSTATAVGRTPAYFSLFTQGLAHSDINSAAFAIQGVYVAYPTFNRAGSWGVEARFVYKGKSHALRQSFSVARHSLSPPVGSAAPQSNNPTTAQKPPYLLDSGRPPDDMHKLSIAGAIAQHKPLVVIFSTPGFCTSRLCGPETEIVASLERLYRGRVNFIHIEIYKNANPQDGYAPTVAQWRLQTEPWVFVIDRHGIITAKFEGPTPASELKPAINAAGRR